MKAKILTLGNEFIKEDSFAKEIGRELTKEGYNIINIIDSFQLIDKLNLEDNFIILDVVDKINEVKLLTADDLSYNSIISSHDIDAQFILKLFNDKNIFIIGIPMHGNINIIKKRVKTLLEQYKS